MIEAICAGLPAIVLDIAAFTEVCDNGKYVLSIRSKYEQYPAGKLRYALDNRDEMKRPGKIARQYARHSFSIENMVKGY